VLTAKGASLPTIGLALTLPWRRRRRWLRLHRRASARSPRSTTEGLTAVLIVALLPLPLEAAMVLLPVIGVALNGTSSVLYGFGARAGHAGAARARLSIFYTGTIGLARSRPRSTAWSRRARPVDGPGWVAVARTLPLSLVLAGVSWRPV
jgi:hypothetical protein